MVGPLRKYGRWRMVMNWAVTNMKSVCVMVFFIFTFFSTDINASIGRSLPHIVYHGFNNEETSIYTQYIDEFERNINETKVPTNHQEVIFILTKISDSLGLKVSIYEVQDEILIFNTAQHRDRADHW